MKTFLARFVVRSIVFVAGTLVVGQKTSSPYDDVVTSCSYKTSYVINTSESKKKVGNCYEEHWKLTIDHLEDDFKWLKSEHLILIQNLSIENKEQKKEIERLTEITRNQQQLLTRQDERLVQQQEDHDELTNRVTNLEAKTDEPVLTNITDAMERNVQDLDQLKSTFYIFKTSTRSNSAIVDMLLLKLNDTVEGCSSMINDLKSTVAQIQIGLNHSVQEAASETERLNGEIENLKTIDISSCKLGLENLTKKVDERVYELNAGLESLNRKMLDLQGKTANDVENQNRVIKTLNATFGSMVTFWNALTEEITTTLDKHQQETRALQILVTTHHIKQVGDMDDLEILFLNLSDRVKEVNQTLQNLLQNEVNELEMSFTSLREMFTTAAASTVELVNSSAIKLEERTNEIQDAVHQLRNDVWDGIVNMEVSNNRSYMNCMSFVENMLTDQKNETSRGKSLVETMENDFKAALERQEGRLEREIRNVNVTIENFQSDIYVGLNHTRAEMAKNMENLEGWHRRQDTAISVLENETTQLNAGLKNLTLIVSDVEMKIFLRINSSVSMLNESCGEKFIWASNALQLQREKLETLGKRVEDFEVYNASFSENIEQVKQLDEDLRQLHDESAARSGDVQASRQAQQELEQELSRLTTKITETGVNSSTELNTFKAEQAREMDAMKIKVRILEDRNADSEESNRTQEEQRQDIINLKAAVRLTQSQFAEQQAQVNSLKTETSKLGGVKYIRWGRTICPNSSALVYKGYIGGNTNHLGGNKYLCLPESPQWGSYVDLAQNLPRISGVEYQFEGVETMISRANNGGRSLTNYDAPCAVCLTPTRSTQLMIPAQRDCPQGWTKEYRGFLAAQMSNWMRSNYLCVDETPEVIPGSQTDQSASSLYPVEGSCGSLKCPPYIGGREMSCVVCTK